MEYLELESGRCPACEFLDAFRNVKSKLGRARVRIYASIEMLGQGERLGSQHFRKEKDTDGVFVIKGFQLRIYCFYTDDGRLILTHGAQKKRDEADPKDLKQTERYRAQFLAELRQRRTQ